MSDYETSRPDTDPSTLLDPSEDLDLREDELPEAHGDSDELLHGLDAHAASDEDEDVDDDDDDAEEDDDEDDDSDDDDDDSDDDDDDDDDEEDDDDDAEDDDDDADEEDDDDADEEDDDDADEEDDDGTNSAPAEGAGEAVASTEPSSDSAPGDGDENGEGERSRSSRGRRRGRGKKQAAAPAEDSEPDDDDDDQPLPEGVDAWWTGWGRLRGFLVSATDRGQPHPEMAAAASKLAGHGATVEALAQWVPTSDERSQLERSRRTVNAACDLNVDHEQAIARVREDLLGEGAVWEELLALAEAWVVARRAGLEPPRRGRRKGRNRGRSRERGEGDKNENGEEGEKKSVAKQAAAAPSEASEPREGGRRRDRKGRRRGRRRPRATLPTGKWAAYPARSWATDAEQFTVYAWFEPATDEVPGTVAGVVYSSWDVDDEQLSLPTFLDLSNVASHDAALEALATLEQSEQALPFRVPTTNDDAAEATRDALRMVFGWLLSEGEKAEVRVVLSQSSHLVDAPQSPTAPADAAAEHAEEAGQDADAESDAATDGEESETDGDVVDAAPAGAEATPETDGDAGDGAAETQVTAWTVTADDLSAVLSAAFTDDQGSDRLARWELASAQLVTALRGAPASLPEGQALAQGYLAYAQLLAATRPGAALNEAADTHLGSPHFEAALTLSTEASSRLQGIASIDRTAATDDLLDLLPLIAGTALADGVVQTAQARMGANAGLQLKLLLGLDARAKAEDRDLPALVDLVGALGPVLGDLPAATPARVRALGLLGAVSNARRHEQLTELATSWTESRDEILSADLELGERAVSLLVDRLNSRVDYVTAREALEHFLGAEATGALSASRRVELMAELAAAESACGHRLRADERFAEALGLLATVEVDEGKSASVRREILRLRALNAMDARLHPDADTERDVPSTPLSGEAEEEDSSSEDLQDDGAEADAQESDAHDDLADDDADGDDGDDGDDDDDADDTDDGDADEDGDDDADEDDDDDDADEDEDEDEDDAGDDDDALMLGDDDDDDDEHPRSMFDEDDDDDVDDDDDDEPTPASSSTLRRIPGAREQLGESAVDMVLAALGAESLEAAVTELATDVGARSREHALLLQLLWSREDMTELEEAYFAAADLKDAHPAPEVELYRGLLLFLSGHDRDSNRALQRAAQAGRANKSTAARLLVATIQVVTACVADGRGGRVRGALRQLRERLPATAAAAVDTLAAIQARPDEDKIDLALGVLPLTLR